MDIQVAKTEVEKLLLKLNEEFGASEANDGTTVEVVLWESPHPAAGIRVAEVSYTKQSPGRMCGSSWMQVDLGGLRACAAVERCLLARVVLQEEGDIADADFQLRLLFTEETKDLNQVEEDQSQGKYVRLGGTHCPFCDSEEITGNEINIDAGTATQEISCSNCDKEWNDLYTLSGYEET